MCDIKSDRTLKLLALCTGIFVGIFYASIGRSIIKKWINVDEMEPSSIKATLLIGSNQNINRTAAFLVPDDTKLADKLAEQISVLCWIYRDSITSDHVKSIKGTWGARCTKLLFLSNHESNLSDVVNLKNEKIRKPNVEDAYNYLISHHLNDSDWFIKTDGDAYVVVENLRYMLYAYDPTQPITIGHRMNSTWTAPETKIIQNCTYYSDLAGYVMSKEAMKRLDLAFRTGPKCIKFREYKRPDRERIGICLNETGVLDGNSFDQNGKKRFFEVKLGEFLLPKVEVNFPPMWYDDYKVDHGLDLASNFSITFHGITPHQMHVMEYLIYQLRPYGLDYETPSLPEKIKLNEIPFVN